ncbi:MAG: YfhO family protein [Bryobacteraceae bacterium]
MTAPAPSAPHPAPPSRSRSAALRLGRFARSHAAGPLLVFLLCCAFCWKLTLSSQYTWLDSPDTIRMDTPRLQFERTAWHGREFPLWDPHLWCGQPFLGEIVGAACPLNWPLFRLRLHGEDRLTLGLLNWYWVYLHFLAALFAYWLCRDLEASRMASLLGGLVFSFAGFSGLLRWPEVLTGLLMAPLVLLFLLRAVRGRRPWSSAALSGMFLGLAWLSGHHEVPIYLSFTVAALWLYDCASRAAGRLRSAALAGVTAVTAILTSGFQTIPGYEYAKLAVRWTGADHPQTWKEAIPYEVHAQYSLAPSSLADLVLPWFGVHTDAFMGIVLLSLAALAVCLRWREQSVRWLVSISVAGFLLALGGWNLFHGVMYAALPLFGKARSPYRFLSIFLLGAAPLAALGVDALRTHGSSPALRFAGRILLAFGAGVWVLGLVSPALHTPGPNDFLYFAALVSLLFGALLVARQRGAVSGRWIGLAAFGLVFMELAGVSNGIYLDRNPGQRQSFLPELTRFHAAANFLRTQPGPVRVDATDATDAFNFGEWEGLDTLYGFGAGVTSNLISMNWPTVPVQNLLGVGYSFSKHDPRPDQQLVFHDSSGFNIYKNLNAFPRAWVVHQAVRASSLETLNARTLDPAFDARRSVLLLDPPPALESCVDSDPARVDWRTSNTVGLSAHPTCRGMLILSDTWYPGWEATVDGRKVPIYQAYSALRGVVLEAGFHRIEFRYRPASALIGGLMSMIGILSACGVAVWERRRVK